MDLHTVTRVHRPGRADEIASWQAGFAWLAGGTWLFSETQSDVHTLIDLESLGWPSLHASADGLEIAATCKVVELDHFTDRAPSDWTAAPLFRECCRSFLASFKIWNEATVGGNVCMSLPAGPMISLTSALEGVCTIWQADGRESEIGVCDFVTGNQRNVLEPGDLLRQIDIPLLALKRRSAFRQISLTPIGRSAALLIGSISIEGQLLTVTASTKRPVRIAFAGTPDAAELREMIQRSIADDLYHDDVHGRPEWRKHMTLRLAEEIRRELAGRQ